jgi:hypothetical protein
MNNFRSPAPGANIFNLGSRNNLVTNVANTAINAAANAANTAANVFGAATNAAANVANTATNTAANIFGAVANTATNTAKNTLGNTLKNTISGGFSMTYALLLVLVVVFIVVVSIFWKQIGEGLTITYDKFREWLGASPRMIPSSKSEEENVTNKPEAPQDNSIQETKIVEKILPGRTQVFNISKNSYTYYDAEPLCKALGAELATYDQVKEAYGKGADWCNYGWVKGQMAVYPTQTDTWEQLQTGPEDQRDACGRPGVNGGFFDNPELRFGVNCYGLKPDQKDHDITAITSGEGAPLSPGGLEFEKKISQYRGDANHIAVLPFSKSAWSA